MNRAPQTPTVRIARLAGLAAVLTCGWAGCNGEKATDTNDTPTPPVVEGCTIDDDCSTGLICEDAECIVGDRDNSFDEGTTLRLNEVREGLIEPPGDIDYFVYESPGQEWLRIQTTNSGDPIDSLDTVVRVFAENGAEHARADNFATGRVNSFDSVAIFWLPRAGTWYVTVEDVSTYYTDVFDEPRGDETFEYTLEMIEFGNGTLEPDSELLPNDVLELPGGNNIFSFGILLEEPGDSDWLVIDPPFAGQPLEVWGTPTPGSDAQPLVRLSERNTPGDADDPSVLVAEKEDVGTDGICSYFDPLDELYTLEATDRLGGGSDDHWYVVYVRTYEPEANHPVFGDAIWEREAEPNDDPADAWSAPLVTELTSNGTAYDTAYVQGTLESGDDIDRIRVEMADLPNLSVRCWADDFGSTADLQVTVLDPSGTDITPQDQGFEPTSAGYLTYNINTSPGAHDVLIEAEDSLGGPSAYYRCAVYLTDFDVDTGD